MALPARTESKQTHTHSELGAWRLSHEQSVTYTDSSHKVDSGTHSLVSQKEQDRTRGEQHDVTR